MKYFLFFLTFLHSFSNWASIYQVNTMEQVGCYFENANCQTLGVFDIDMVLIQPAEPAFQMANIKKHASIAKKILKTLTEDEQIAFVCLETVKSYPVLIESYTYTLLEELDTKHVKCIALTGNLTGAFDAKENMQKWTVERLKLCGIDFSKTFAFDGEMLFENLPSYRGNYTLFTDGILFANGQRAVNKGYVLNEFLNRINYKPSKVIFIDDRLDNIKDVEDKLHSNYPNIEFVGLHYKGAYDYLSPNVDAATFERLWLIRAEEAKEIVESEKFHILPINTFNFINNFFINLDSECL